MSDKPRLEEIREALEREIAELESRLQLYQQLLAILDECSGLAGARGRAGGRGREFRSKDGLVVARLTASRDTMRLMFARPVPERHPYVRYMLNALERLASEYEGLEYTVDRDEEGRVSSVIVTGVPRDAQDEVHAVLEFTAKKVAEIPPR
ncbi:hypothetical protein CF15_03205 [Pyrodictium occultum]|uniref:Uncharacterized protein n=1 Tax=Pyrodictium occultum TaxID=2309 RepID=A0A0V8RUV4_PYROC|nr:hypothetical protein [Pyrodictium occultum]KSW11822.1 hypothetical protein CF15_03205 [Pyrodictium occultum]